MNRLMTALGLALALGLSFASGPARADEPDPPPPGGWEYRSPYRRILHLSDADGIQMPLGGQIRVENAAFDPSGYIHVLQFRLDGGTWHGAYGTVTPTGPGIHQVELEGWRLEVLEDPHQEVQMPWSRSIPIDVVDLAFAGGWRDEGDLYAPYFSITHLAGGASVADHPVLIVEGFDPDNRKDVFTYYDMAPEFFETLRALGRDIFFLDFADGGADMAANAHVVQRTLGEIENLGGGADVAVVGLSMGGVVSRYALAEAEQLDLDLPVSHFLSIDAPQQGAVVPADFQQFLRDKGQAPSSLSSVAARQLLMYSAYTSLHESFYGVLNALNGDGYPHLCRTIAASFTPEGLLQNPGAGERWAELDVSDTWYCDWFSDDLNFHITSSDPVAEPGSLLPHGNLVDRHGVAENGNWPECDWNLRFFDEGPDGVRPTFIPHASALDLDEAGNSRFGVTILPQGVLMADGTYGPYSHDEFPNETAFLLAILGALGIPLPDQMIAGTYDGCERQEILAQHTLTNLNASGAPQAVLFQVAGGCTPGTIQLGAGRTVRLAAGPAATVRFMAGVEARIFADPTLDAGGCVARDPASVGSRGNLVLAQIKPATEPAKARDGAPALRTALLQNTPNPFNPSTRIDFTLAQSGPVLVQVFDLKGSTIATLVDGIRSAGRHTVEWQGLDDRDRHLNSGVYFYRLVAPGYTSVKKMIMIK